MDTGLNARAAAVSASRMSCAQLDVGRRDVELELLDAGRTGNRHHAGKADQPRQCHLRGFGPDLVGDRAQRAEQRFDPAQILRSEQRIRRPDPARPVVDAVLAAQKSLRERAVRHHHPVLAFGEGDQIVERARVGQREVHLVADHGPTESGIGLAPTGERIVRHARCADETVVEQAPHARHDHRIGDERVRLVDLIERDAVQLEPTRAGPCALPRDRRERRDGKDLARHHDIGPLRPERLAENAFAAARSVHLGGVEQGDTHGAGAGHDVASRTRGVLVAVTPLAGTELPRAEADAADRSEPVDVEKLHADHRTDVSMPRGTSYCRVMEPPWVRYPVRRPGELDLLRLWSRHRACGRDIDATDGKRRKV